MWSFLFFHRFRARPESVSDHLSGLFRAFPRSDRLSTPGRPSPVVLRRPPDGPGALGPGLSGLRPFCEDRHLYLKLALILFFLKPPVVGEEAIPEGSEQLHLLLRIPYMLLQSFPYTREVLSLLAPLNQSE